MIKKIQVTKNVFFLLVQASLGGLISGISLFEGISFLMPFAIALLWASSKVPIFGFIWGGVAVLYSHKWILSLHPLDWVGISSYLSLPISIFIWLFCGFLGGVLVFFWTLLLNKTRIKFDCEKSFYRQILIAFIFSLVWGISEVFLAKGPFFWIGISASLLPSNRWLAAWASIFGAGGLATIQFLIGWWIWQLSISLSQKNKFYKLLLYGFITLSLGNLFGWNLINDQISSETIKVALWQSNIPIREKFSEKERKSLPLKIKSVLSEAKESESLFLIAPEGTLLTNNDVLEEVPVNFLAGGFRSVGNQKRSSLFVIEAGNRKYSEFLDKHRLVPLGEWVPKLLPNLSLIGGIEPGESSRLLHWHGPSLIGVICYEISDGRAISKAAINGGEWIVSIANLDPYPIALQRQFLALAQLRSIESGRDLVSVSNTGPTSLINRFGEVKYILPSFKEDVAIVEVNLSNEKTFYSIFGERSLIFLLTFSLILLFLIQGNYKLN